MKGDCSKILGNHIWPVITKDTDPEEVIKIHKVIWDWVAVYGHKPPTPYVSDCVLCEYRRVTNSCVCLCGMDCQYCDDAKDCMYGLYNKWYSSLDHFRYYWAIKIRDFFENRRYAKNTSAKIGRELNNKIGGKNDGN